MFLPGDLFATVCTVPYQLIAYSINSEIVITDSRGFEMFTELQLFGKCLTGILYRIPGKKFTPTFSDLEPK